MKPGVWPGQGVEVDLLRERLAAGVDLEDLLAALAVGAVDDDLAVEAAGAKERRVEDVRPVGGGDEDDVVLHLEAVHLDEELVQRLLALVVAAAHAGAAVAADGVDLVHEDDAGGVLLGLLEEVAHAAGADADEHLDEVGAGDREEGHARLAGDGAGEQRLTRAGRAVEEDALGDPGAERLELLGVLEELLDLVELLDRLVGAGDVAEGDLGRVHGHPLRLRLAEAHDARAAALHLVHEEDPEAEEEQERKDVGERAERIPPPVMGSMFVSMLLLLERVDQRVLLLGEVAGLVLGSVGERVLELVLLLLEDDRLDRVRLGVDALGELVEGRDVLGLAGADHAAGEERQHEDDQDRECGRAEEAPHAGLPGIATRRSGTRAVSRARKRHE